MNKQQIKDLPSGRRKELLLILQNRFGMNMNRHQGLEWSGIQSRLHANPGKFWSLNEMENTGGEPDVIGYDPTSGEYIFADCSKESPAGRRSICYDQEALESRKENKPGHSAVGMAAGMGVELLTEEQYVKLQQFGEFDTKTSSWISTPKSIRDMGGAIFGDKRYRRTFIYHNGADSYYSARGFRALLRV